MDAPLDVAPAFIKARTDKEQLQAIKDEIARQGALPADHEGLNDEIGKRSLMHPRSHALQHDAAPLLHTYATKGCPVHCGKDWSREHIIQLLRRGPHKSAKSKKAIAFLRNETDAKVKEHYAKVVKWKDIKHNVPAKLKISPVAMVPHKSKMFRCILDLSFGLRVGETQFPSVNDATIPQSKQESMLQLGQALKRIIQTMARERKPGHPFYFTKLDIKDGFWRMAVSDEDAWNFAYVLPSMNPDIPLDEIELVIPNSLQMGWCESPPFFCTASETGRDVIEELLKGKIALPEHIFEQRMFDPQVQYSTLPSSLQDPVTLIEVYVDDYIAMTNDISINHLTTVSRAMLHGIHTVFPPPSVTGHNGGDPIAEKKIDKGEGLWQPTKEILGWIFDGVQCTIQLPPDKLDTIAKLTKRVLKSKATPLQRFQELAGKLQHASFGIPGGKGMFSPIYAATIGNPPFVTITPALRRTLEDWRSMIKHFTHHPTPIELLLPDYPEINTFTDACKLGAGGVVTSGSIQTLPIVWQVEWPMDIQAKFDKLEITINDLELAGMVLGWLALDDLAPSLDYMHIGIFSDNTSAVAWLTKGSTTTSKAAGALLRFLHHRIRLRRASPCIPIYIPGEYNTMADVSSRAFKEGKFFVAHNNLTSYFNLHFPQSSSWQEYKHHKEWVMRVISCLRGTQLEMASLTRLPKTGQSTGHAGTRSAKDSTWIQLFKQHPSSPPLLPPPPLPPKSEQGHTGWDKRLKLAQYLQRYQLSPRPSSWLEQQVPSWKHRDTTSHLSNVYWKDTDE